MPLTAAERARIQSRYRNGTADAVTTYVENARTASDRWKRNAAGAADSYDSAMRAVLSDGRWATGIDGTPASRYADGVSAAGTRYSTGTAAASERLVNAIETNIEIIDDIADTLPERAERGAMSNYDRSRLVGQALNTARREGRTGA